MTARELGGRKTRVEASAEPLHAELRRRFELTPTECAVAVELLGGKTYQAIARSLGVSVHTVHSHVKAIHRKADVTSSLQFVSRFKAAPS